MIAKQRALQWFVAPLGMLSTRARWPALLAITLVVALGSSLAARSLASPFDVPDALLYMHMAEGRITLVNQPFASRPLAPLLVRGFAAATHCRVETGFILLGWLSVVCALLAVFWLAFRSSAPRWTLLALAVVPFWPQLLHAQALPDPLYTALFCGLLLCLERDRLWLAALVLFPLMVSREATSLALLCLLAVGWRRLRWSGCLLAVAATAGGSLLVTHLSAGAQGNTEHLPELVYVFAKLPWNLLRSFGVLPWSNVYPYLCHPPARQFAVHVGPLQAVGVCSTSLAQPSELLQALLTTFGLLPVLLLPAPRTTLRRPWRKAFPSLSLLERFCLVYGVLSCLLAPMIGTWYVRLFGYAWPLFLVLVPRLLGASAARSSAPPQIGLQIGLQIASQNNWQNVRIAAFLVLHACLAGLAFMNPTPRVLAACVLLVLAGTALWCWPDPVPPGVPGAV